MKTLLVFVFFVAVLGARVASAQVSPGPQVVQLPDGSYLVIVPQPSTVPPGVPPSYASPPPGYAEPPAPAPQPGYVPAPTYAPHPGYAPQQLPSGAPYAQPGSMSARGYTMRDDVLARVGRQLHRERKGLLVGSIGAAAFALGAVFSVSAGADGTTVGLGGGQGAGMALMVLGGATSFGGFYVSSVAGLRTSRDFALLGAPNGRGLAVTSIVSLALLETAPLVIPLGWLHYGRARRHYAMLTGGRSQATLELSIRPMFDPTTGLRGAAIGGSF